MSLRVAAIGIELMPSVSWISGLALEPPRWITTCAFTFAPFTPVTRSAIRWYPVRSRPSAPAAPEAAGVALAIPSYTKVTALPGAPVSSAASSVASVTSGSTALAVSGGTGAPPKAARVSTSRTPPTACAPSPDCSPWVLPAGGVVSRTVKGPASKSSITSV
jgi:hypothetical protein